MGLLDGRVALVTGGSRGLGKAICKVLGREGAKVAFNYSRCDEDAQQALQELRQAGITAFAFKASVLDRAALEQMVRQLEREAGIVDVLVNNAGISRVTPFALLEESDWDEVMAVNVKGVYLATQVALRGMIRQRRGRILNIGSLAGVKMLPAPVTYCASKAAIKGLTEALAKEVGPYGVTVNHLAPGALDEGVSHHIPPHRMEEYLRHCALGRPGGVQEIAETVAFLVSDRNSYMNGATVQVDGAV